ncbi:MAG: PASTA domain-containing protein, partial [Acidobacteriota bacterium]
MPAPGTGLKTRLRGALLRGLEYVVIAGGLLATGVVSAFITFTLAIQGNEVEVPNLLGASLAGAAKALTRVELNLRQEGNRFDDTVPPDFVSAQSPSPGAKLKKGRSVKVWISLGPQRRVVPRIEGESLQSAQLILEQKGFSLGRVVEVHSEIYAPDTVIGQDPPAYEEAGDVTEVTVLLSRGYVDDAYVMPDFIGHDYADILDRMQPGRLRISEIRYVNYPGVPRGTVVRQFP